MGLKLKESTKFQPMNCVKNFTIHHMRREMNVMIETKLHMAFPTVKTPYVVCTLPRRKILLSEFLPAQRTMGDLRGRVMGKPVDPGFPGLEVLYPDLLTTVAISDTAVTTAGPIS
jgi:hypothetical protein